MDRMITNKHDAYIDVRVVNDVINIKHVLMTLNEWHKRRKELKVDSIEHYYEKRRLEDMIDRWSAKLHRLVVGWE